MGGQMFAHRLRVSQRFGVGLDLEPELNGLRVLRIHSQPGQPGLWPDDLIFQINGNALCGSLVLIEQTFGSNIEDGVILAVKRDIATASRTDSTTECGLVDAGTVD